MQAPEALSSRVLRDQRLELADHLVVAPEPELGLDPVLVRDEAQLLEARDLALRERLVAQVRERRPAPEGERLGEQLGGLAKRTSAQRGVSFFREPLEAFRVELVRIDRAAGTPPPSLDTRSPTIFRSCET